MYVEIHRSIYRHRFRYRYIDLFVCFFLAAARVPAQEVRASMLHCHTRRMGFEGSGLHQTSGSQPVRGFEARDELAGQCPANISNLSQERLTRVHSSKVDKNP